MRTRCLTLLCCLVAVEAAPARAQGRSSLFSSPVSVSSGMEEIPGPAGSTPETMMLISPMNPYVTFGSARTRFALSYQPEIEVALGQRKFNAWNHFARFDFSQDLSRRTRLSIAHSFILNSDPVRLFADNLFVIPRTDFRENSTAGTVIHDLSRRTSLTFRVDNSITRISTPEDGGATYLDQRGLAGTFGVSRHLSPRHKLTATYSLFRFSPYEFGTDVDAVRFSASIPTVRAGLSRYALRLIDSVASSATYPTGMASGGAVGSPTLTSPPPTPAAVPVALELLDDDNTASTPGANSLFGGSGGDGPANRTEAPPTTPPTAASPTAGPPPPGPESTTAPPAPPSPPFIDLPTDPLVGVVTPLPRRRDDKKDKKDRDDEDDDEPGRSRSDLSPDLTVVVSGATPAESAAAIAPELRLLGDPFHVGGLSYMYTHDPGLVVSLFGGVMRDRDTSYLMGVEVEQRLDRLWFATGLQQFLSYYGSLPASGGPPVEGFELTPGLRPSSLFTAATFTIGGRIGRKLELEVTGSLSKSTANFLEHNVRSAIGRARVSYWFTDYLSFFVSADSFNEEQRGVPDPTFSRDRLFGGIQMRFSPAPRPAAAAAR